VVQYSGMGQQITRMMKHWKDELTDKGMMTCSFIGDWKVMTAVVDFVHKQKPIRSAKFEFCYCTDED
jgi:hypothetical protein